MSSQWLSAFCLEDLPPGQARLVRHGVDRIAVFHLGDGQLRAIDDRCPHEGYPLCQGQLRGEVLTCCFHNYKFDLRSGACLLGDERVRTWPVRLVDKVVQLDVTPPDPAAELARRWESLDIALLEDRIGQIAREVVRLLALGIAPGALAAAAAAFDGARAPYGSSHTLAVAADAPHLISEGLAAAGPLVIAFEIAARRSARRAPHPPAHRLDPGDPDTFAARIRARVEAEELEIAEGLLRGALAEGWDRSVLEATFLLLASDHFLDYGHALIYATKVGGLLEHATPEQVTDILCGLLRGITWGTREDTLPAWRGWRRRVEEVAPRLGAWGAQDAEVPDPEALIAALLDGGSRVALDAVLARLDAGVGPSSLARILSDAAARRLLRFDPRHDLDPQVQDTWLAVTHVQTFCHAVQRALEALDHPDLVRLVLQATRMVAMTRPLDLPEDERTLPAPRPGGPEAVIAAIIAGDPESAVAATLGAEPDALWAPLLELILDDPVTRPLYAGHLIKQLPVAFADARQLGDLRPIAALVRFLASPRQERTTARRVREAIALVRDGAVPRRLVS